ncbi:MAG: methyltransferase [Candidatus Diapherotrites archaeon]|uniref:Methyltransferase n=1 Tax=Candidatus Iainarchaeum sp. TaxID=3101447 RepID=A0A939C4G3_9ARCH|nr:methyltransferase [Candidatus Diapherotrites archaeon]
MKLEDLFFQEPENGYPPKEDSWLLAKNIPSVQGKKCLDMGCGSGIQTAALLMQGAGEVACVDINPDALAKTRQLVSSNFPNAKIETVQSNLFEKVEGKFDVIVFNAPYVPSEGIK